MIGAFKTSSSIITLLTQTFGLLAPFKRTLFAEPAPIASAASINVVIAALMELVKSAVII